jgi:RNA polymerase sigma factor (sigma-70 family)
VGVTPHAATQTDGAISLLAHRAGAFRNTARRCSLCADDAEDAYQRAVEILLTKAPPVGQDRLAAWMHVVTRREALAVRRARERLLGAAAGQTEGETPIERLACQSPGPAESAERRERFESAASALAHLSRDQRVAIVLQACGYSYDEIAAARGWTYTKVNRCMAEGRRALRERFADIYSGAG